MTNDELHAIETRHAALPDVWDYTTVPSPEELAQLHADHGKVLAEVRRLRALVEAAYLEGHEAGWDGREPFGDVWDGSKSKRALDP